MPSPPFCGFGVQLQNIRRSKGITQREAAIILGGKSEWVERVFTAQRCHLFFSAGETIDSAAHTICALAIGHEKEYIASRDLNLIRNRKYAIVSQ